eukprot:2633462-Pyramimonas_sp.AAC.1
MNDDRTTKTGLARDDTATLRGGFREPPARHATLETGALTRDLARAAHVPMSAQTNLNFCVAQVGGGKKRALLGPYRPSPGP